MSDCFWASVPGGAGLAPAVGRTWLRSTHDSVPALASVRSDEARTAVPPVDKMHLRGTPVGAASLPGALENRAGLACAVRNSVREVLVPVLSEGARLRTPFSSLARLYGSVCVMRRGRSFVDLPTSPAHRRS